MLAATDQIPLHALDGAMFIGELSLDGSILHVKGVLPMVYAARQYEISTVFVPQEDAAEAALVQGIDVIPVRSLGQLVEHLYQLNPIQAVDSTLDKTKERLEKANGVAGLRRHSRAGTCQTGAGSGGGWQSQHPAVGTARRGQEP